MAKIRVLLADEQALFREGLALLLRRYEDIEVVAVVSNGTEALEQVMNEQPDLVIMDVKMPGIEGLEAIRRLLMQVPDIKILILTSFSDNDLVAEAIKSGVCGYILKEEDCTSLVNAIQQVYRGECALSPAVASKLAAEYRRLARDISTGPILTERERLMLQRIAVGKTDREIASEMNLALQTVKNTLSGLFQKLGVTNRSHAVAWAISQGWISPIDQADEVP
jgi:two-component system response regulator DegU